MGINRTDDLPWYRTLHGYDSKNSLVDVHGYRDALGTAPKVISPWEQDAYIFTEIAQPYYVSSTDAGNTQKLKLIVLDADYRVKTYNVTLDGKNKVQVDPADILRILYAYTEDVTPFAGTVYIFEDTTVTGAGVPTDDLKVRATILEKDQITKQAVFTVPDGYGASVYAVSLNIYGVKDPRYLDMSMYARRFGETFLRFGTFSVNNLSSNSEKDILTYPFVLRPKTDIYFAGNMAHQTAGVSIGIGIMFRPIHDFFFSDELKEE